MTGITLSIIFGSGLAGVTFYSLCIREQWGWWKNITGKSPVPSSRVVLWMNSCRVYWLSTRRRRAVQAELPDFLDLLALGLSSGQNIENAWAMAHRHVPPGFLKKQVQAVLQGMVIGRSREDSFGDLARRLNDPRLRLFFALLIQSMKTGGRLQRTLHEQAAALRRHRLTEIERKAQTAPLRLLLPMFIFIFPTIFLLLFAPLIIRITHGGSLF